MTEKAQPQAPTEPEGYGRHLTEAEDTEGHKKHFRATEPAPDEPGAEDTEGHEIKATEDAPMPDGYTRH